MEELYEIIKHLLSTKNSIDDIDKISDSIQIDKDEITKMITHDEYKDYFQLLHQNTQKNPNSSLKIALTLDLFTCTHYAIDCKKNDCPFLHLCPYNVRPQHEKCTNKSCPFEHDIKKSEHNKTIIKRRHLAKFPAELLQAIVRASNDPERSFWVCQDYGRKGGCPKRHNCDKLHYCFFGLTDQCTKSHNQCDHSLNPDCMNYLRRKQMHNSDETDILDAFRKVAKQRNLKYLSTLAQQSHTSGTATAISNKSAFSISSQEATTNRNESFVVRPTATNFQRKPKPSAQNNVPSNNRMERFLSETEPPQSPLDNEIEVETDEDNCIESLYTPADYDKIEKKLSAELNCPCKVCLVKKVSNKTKQIHFELALSQQTDEKASKLNVTTTYCPIEKSSDILDYIRWQNPCQTPKFNSVLLYLNIQDAHDRAKQQNNDQFCLLRGRVLDATKCEKIKDQLKVTDPKSIIFEELWLYKFDF